MNDALISLASEEHTRRLGEAIGDALRCGDVVLLSGPLGAGKTTLARAVLARRCGAQAAPSPTFTFVETYEGGDLTVWHFDFYRLENAQDAWELGIEDAFAEGASLVEWPERAAAVLPEEALSINITLTDGARVATLSATETWRDRLKKIAAICEESK